MAWTFDPRLPVARDEVRARIGGVDDNEPLLQDETIDALLVHVGGSVVHASVRAVRIVLGKLNKDLDRNAVGMSSQRSQRVQHFRDVLTDLEAELASHAVMFVGGTTVSGKRKLDAEIDFDRPSFGIGRDDYR